MASVKAGLSNLIRRLRGCERGNVTIIFAFACMPMLLALCTGVDYGIAMKRQARMNAAADAAALSAVTPTMMSQSPAIAQATAVAFFNTQVASLVGVAYASNVSIQVTDNNTGSAIARTVNVSYQAGSANTFGGVVGMPTLTIKGTSASTASVSPNIDFYLMLDTSPSMAIAATQPGIDKMIYYTPNQTGGCAFACHELNPASDNLGNPFGEDNYALARQLGVTLRIDLVTQAVQNLMVTAQQTENSTGAVYRMGGYTFDVTVKNPIPAKTANLTTAQLLAANIQMLTVWNENYLTSSNYNYDEDTDFNNAFSTINGVMPTPGNGTNLPGDKPQEVLFLVSDGVADANISGNRNYAPFGVGTQSGSTDWCTAIKARNIRIAVLYTTYLPLPTSSWYNAHVSALQPTIATVASKCASPGLYFQVNVGGDISAAMTTLFATAVSSAHLTQ